MRFLILIIAAFVLGWHLPAKDPDTIDWGYVTIWVYVALLVTLAEMSGRYYGKSQAQKKHIKYLQEIIADRDVALTIGETEAMAEAMHDAFELNVKNVRDVITWCGKKTQPEHLRECNAWREVAKAAFLKLR